MRTMFCTILLTGTLAAAPLRAEVVEPTTRPAPQPQVAPATLPTLPPHERLERIEKVAAEASPLRLVEAPNFALQDEAGQQVMLSDYAGKWVLLYFFPGSDLPSDCACKGHDYTRLLTELKDMGAEVLAVSSEPPEVLANRKKLYGLDSRLLSDPSGATAKQYGAWTETTIDGKTFARTVRSTFVIGPDGRIRRHWPDVTPENHASRVRAFLRGWKLFEYRNPEWLEQAVSHSQHDARQKLSDN